MNLTELLNNNVVVTTVLVIICVNIALSATGKILDKIKDKTKTEIDNKAAVVVKKMSAVLTTVLDWVGANRAHK